MNPSSLNRALLAYQGEWKDLGILDDGLVYGVDPKDGYFKRAPILPNDHSALLGLIAKLALVEKRVFGEHIAKLNALEVHDGNWNLVAHEITRIATMTTLELAEVLARTLGIWKDTP